MIPQLVRRMRGDSSRNGDNQGRMNGDETEWPSLAVQIKRVDARSFCQSPDALVPISVPPRPRPRPRPSAKVLITG